MKKWIVSRFDEAKVRTVTSSTDLPRLLAEIMAARGYDTVESLAGFFNGDSLSDPFLMLDMDKAVDAINEAVESGGLICVYGDYDCDGVTSAAVLSGYLESMGANVMTIIPERSDGYGLNEAAVRRMSDEGVSLIITVDNGISAVAEAELINELGMRLVVTDHHQPSEELPDAVAIVDPHRQGDLSPFKPLCGAGVVLKLCAALDGGNYDMVCEQYLDLVAIATIADVVPLTGENRVIVSQGLNLIKNTENIGLLSLLEECGIAPGAMSSGAVAFSVAPRINAASRFGSPMTAFKMLTAGEDTASEFAKELVKLNCMRKSAEDGIMTEIISSIDADPALLRPRVLIAAGRDWHRGVIGIVAARLVELYGKPSVVISVDSDGFACGSARSIPGFNVFKCFDSCRDLLVKYGGHELAGGLTFREENMSQVREAIERCAYEQRLSFPVPIVTADKLLRGSDITVQNAEALLRIEPCGCANPHPVFALSGAQITAIHPLKCGEHTKLEISYDGAKTSLLMFRTKTSDLPYKVGDRIDVMANMSLNEYKGVKSVALKAIDHRAHGIRQERYFAAREVYDSFSRGEAVDKKLLARGLPTRAELVELYKLLSKQGTTYVALYSALCGKINAFKLQIMVDAFRETGLINYSPTTGKIEPITPAARVDIEKSETLTRLRETLQ